MSGIYLIVWNNTDKDKCRVLKPTKGGYPHITLAYTGKNLSVEDLVKTAQQVFAKFAQQNITLTKAYVNSFKPSNGPMRHDVLIELKETDLIEGARKLFLQDAYANSQTFSMNKPHVTHGIFTEQEEAEKIATWLNQAFLPLNVVITGVTID